MSQEIEASGSLAYMNPAKSITRKALAVAAQKADIGGANYAQGLFTVPTTAGGTAIPLSGVDSPGWFFIKNCDGANFVQILTQVAGTAFLKLPPGEFAMGRFADGITAPAALADTDEVDIEYLILEP